MKRIYLFLAAMGFIINSYSQTGDLVWEIFSGFAGTYADLSVTTIAPSKSTVITTFNGPQTSPDLNSYKSRIQGYIFPAVTGDYTFYIASDDGSEFWLSTDTAKANKVRICLASTARTSYTNNAEQKSAAIPLVAGNVYYFEALHNEASGGDLVKVGWTKPGEAPATINTIGAQYISRIASADINIASISVPSGRVPKNSKNNILYKMSIAVSKMNTVCNKISFKTGGTFTSTDACNFKLLYNDSILSLTGAIQIGTTDTVVTSGDSLVFTFSKSLPDNDTIYFFLVADITSGAVENATVSINAVSFNDIVMPGVPNKIGTNPLPAGGTKTIQNIAPSGIKISKDTLSILGGYSSALSALITPDSASFKKVYWFCDNTSKATVDSNGKILTKIDGTVRIIVMTYDSALSDTCTLTILPNNVAVKDLYINPGSLFIGPGDTYQLGLVTNPAYATRQTLVWSSGSSSIASVDSNGLVTGAGSGKAVITATIQGTKQAMCVVYVFAHSLTSAGEGIQVYPVPATDEITLKLKNNNYSRCAISNLDGKVFAEKNILNETETTINIKSLPAGIYFITLTGNSTAAVKFIKE